MHGLGGGATGVVGHGTGGGGHMGMVAYTGDAGIVSGGTAMAAGSSSLLQELPEVNSVLVNILLYDTALNVFRDHNFDSSSVCVCNADTQKIGNIRGADSGVYVPCPGLASILSLPELEALWLDSECSMDPVPPVLAACG